jgi:hypothetical protein
MTNIFDKSAGAYLHGFLTGIIYFFTSAIINEYWPNDFFTSLSDFWVIIVWAVHLVISTVVSYCILRLFFRKKILFFNVFAIMISVLLTSLLMTVYVYRQFTLYNAFLAATLVLYQLFDIFIDIKKNNKVDRVIDEKEHK